MKCAKWKSEKWNDNLSYCVVNIRRMEVSLEIRKVSGLSDATSEMVFSYSSRSVWQRWSHVEKLHHRPARTRSCPTFSLYVTSIKLQYGCEGMGLRRWATTLVIGTQEIWLSLTLTCLWCQILLIPSVEDTQRESLWAFIIYIWMHTDKAVRWGVKNDLESLCQQELIIFGFKFFSLWASRV